MKIAGGIGGVAGGANADKKGKKVGGAVGKAYQNLMAKVTNADKKANTLRQGYEG